MNESSSGSSGRGALAELKEAVSSLFEQVVGMAPDLGFGREFPRHELRVEDEGYRARVELPGLRRDDVEVAISGRTLSISGDRPKFKPPEGAHLIRSERPSGEFSLSIRLPAEVATLGVVARMQDGVLEIWLPKPSSQGRNIEVEANEGESSEQKGEGETPRMPWEEGSQTGGSET